MTQCVADEALGKIARQQNDLFRRVREGTLDPAVVSAGLQLVTENRVPKVQPLADSANGGVTFARPGVPDVKLFLEEMGTFYGAVYDKVLPKKLATPVVCEGFCWGLVMLPGITIEQDLTGCRKNYPVWCWTGEDLDVLTKSVRNAGKPYAVWFRDRVESDQETANKSYNDLQKAGIPGITLPERIRLERWFFWKTGQHLDTKSITRCDGSLSRGGSVPRVDFYGGEPCVGWCSRDVAYGSLRSREAVV